MKKILVVGPVLSRSGYGEQSRFALKALRSREDLYDIYIKPINWGATGWVWRDNDERKWIDKNIRKTAEYAASHAPYFDISLQITIPQEWQKMAPINIGFTSGTESTKISPQWIEKSLLMDKIIVVSEHTKYAFENTKYTAKNQETGQVVEDFKCTTPMEVINYPVREFNPELLDDFNLEYDFNYIMMGQWSPRKNIENTIRWWLEEYWDKKVGLIFKGSLRNDSIVDREHFESKVKDIIRSVNFDKEEKECKI